MYKIAGWSDRYETHESRKLKKLAWVAVPNGHDSLGYRKITREPDACDLFAAWVLILQVASKASTVEGRGTLQNGATEYSPEDLADMTGFPACIFARAFSFFSSERVKWLEPITCGYIPEKSAGVPGESAGTPGKSPDTLQDITVHNMEGNIFRVSAGTPGESAGRTARAPVDDPDAGYPADFLAFWKAYPGLRKKKKGAALRSWKAATQKRTPAFIMASLERHKESCDDWLKDGGQFIPGPEVWLNGGGYDAADALPEPEPVRYLSNGERAF